MSLRGVITSEELPANLVVVAPDLAQHAYAIESSQGHDRQGPTEADPKSKRVLNSGRSERRRLLVAPGTGSDWP
jgi:hypothetical protein